MTLQVTNLHVASGGRSLVQDVGFTLSPGSITAVLGANGAGKSELVLALAGMMPVASGSILLDGRELSGQDPARIRRAGLAAVPEGHRVFTRLSVDDNLRAAGSIDDFGSTKTLADTYALFPELAERKGQLAGTMSGGQQQMLALAHAMMAQPRYLLIDEMSLGLAPLVVKRLMDFVVGLKSRGTGILLIEQFTDLALSVSDQAIVLRGGKPRFAGDAAILRNDPKQLDAAYFGQ